MRDLEGDADGGGMRGVCVMAKETVGSFASRSVGAREALEETECGEHDGEAYSSSLS